MQKGYLLFSALSFTRREEERKTGLIERSVDTTLTKVGYWFDNKTNKYVDNLGMTYQELHSLSKVWNVNGDRANSASPKKITLHEINDKTALGKVEAVWGVDYFQLAKVDGQWKIKNIIWQSSPKERQKNK